MNQYLKGALVANAASMGFNWVYNMPYLERLSLEQSLVFQPVDPQKYKRSGKSYLAYPDARIGDVSAQGEISKWLYQALDKNPELTRSDYKDLIFNQIQPGGSYHGYVESYGKKLIINQFNESMKFIETPLKITDDQLVGFIPYLVCKELGLGVDKAWALAQAFTDISDYKVFFDVFDFVFDTLKQGTLKEALEKSMSLAPKSYQEHLKLAIEMDDTKAFIINHSGTACHIPHALPLIYHILSHSSSYEEAIKKNTQIGGASCDRGMLIGAIYAQVSAIPNAWIKLSNLE